MLEVIKTNSCKNTEDDTIIKIPNLFYFIFLLGLELGESRIHNLYLNFICETKNNL